MIILTGPQTTADQRGDLYEMAGLIGATPAFRSGVQWADVERLLHMSGWESCPLAVADVDVATALGVPVHSVAAFLN